MAGAANLGGLAVRAIAKGLSVVLVVAAMSVGLAAEQAAAGDRNRDPGILLELERETYRVTATDLASGERATDLRVAVGSPAHPTPTGEFRLYSIIHDPDWEPGETARKYGAERVAASSDGPLGVAKIPFSGAYALHGGANPFTVSKPLTLGCLRATDASLEALIVWLDAQGALGRVEQTEEGERPQPFRRPARIVIR